MIKTDDYADDEVICLTDYAGTGVWDFYEMDRRQDGGLQCDVFRCDENLTYIETLAFVNYDLYRVLDDGQMVFIR